MSVALHSVTLTAIQGGETHAAVLYCSTGDLFQRYNSTAVFPDWEADTSKQPVLSYHLASGANTSDDTIPESLDLYYDNEKVVFPSGSNPKNTASGTIPAGMFQLLGGGQQQYRIKILKNLCAAGIGSQPSHVVKAVGKIGQLRYPAAIPADVQPLSGTGEEVHIIGGSGDDPQFTVNEGTGKGCSLVAQVYENGQVVSSPKGRTFKWSRQTPSGWSVISGATSATLAVKPGDVEAYAVYKVDVTNSNTGVTCTDTQSVMDVGDNYYVAIACTDGSSPADNAFPVGAPDSEKRVFTASLLPRKSGNTVPPHTVTWQLTRPDGTILNSSYSGGMDSNGVIDMTQQNPSISIPRKYLKDNSAETITVTAFISF